MKLKIPLLDHAKRKVVLDKTNHNAQIIPTELVPYDLMTDSLQHQIIDFPFGKSKEKGFLSKPAILEFQELVKELFGFPYAIPISQGRTAEALLSKLLVKNGTVIPCNAPFPTTMIHQEINGGLSIETAVAEAYQVNNSFPFKGNVELDRLEYLIRRYTPRWIPYVSIETCVNSFGGQPISLDNLLAVKKLTRTHGVKISLDSCRILENAYQIKSMEPAYKNDSIWSIVKKMCETADYMTMSLTKDFPLPIGGMVCFRDQTTYEEAFDFIVALGDGLSEGSKEEIVHALQAAKKNTDYIEKRMKLVQLLHQGLGFTGIPLAYAAGGHAVLIDLKKLLPNEDQELVAEALNHELYLKYGIRGGAHLLSRKQKEENLNLFRLAVPVAKWNQEDIVHIVKQFEDWNKKGRPVPKLKKISVPAGFSGDFRASYECI